MNLPSKDIGDLLVSMGIGTRATGADWRVAQGTSPAKPDRCITIYDTPGLTPDPKWQQDEPTVMIHIRGAPTPDDYPVAGAKAKEVRDALLGRPSETLGGTLYAGIWSIGDVGYIGPDENGRPVFSMNFRLLRSGSGGYRE